MLVISSWETWTTWQAQLFDLWNWLVSSSLQVRKCHCFSHGRLSMFPFTSFDCCGTDLGPTIIGNEQAWRPENAADWQFLLLACHFVGPWCNLCKMKQNEVWSKMMQTCGMLGKSITVSTLGYVCWKAPNCQGLVMAVCWCHLRVRQHHGSDLCSWKVSSKNTFKTTQE